MSDNTRTLVRDLLVLGCLGSVVLFTNLGGPRLWDRDEPRNAGCAAEMRARGDWVTPWFNDELRTHKPVLLYWLIMSAYSVLGVNEFAARFWSAALGIGTVWLTYALGRRLFEPRVGLWAGVVLLTTLMFDIASRAATPDASLLFSITLSLTLYVLREFPRGEAAGAGPPAGDAPVSQPRDWRHAMPLGTAMLVYGAMGLAVLAKGPVGAVLPTAIVGMFLLIMRLPARSETTGESVTLPRRLWTLTAMCLRPFAPSHFLATCWAMRPLTALAMILLVAGPWYAWVGWRTEGEFLRGFFWQHNVARAVQTFEGHRGGAWFYPVAITIGFFPWSVFALPLSVDAWRRWRGEPAARMGLTFALCWAAVWIGLFSLAKTKLPSYVTPSYPALALLMGAYLVRWRDATARVGSTLARLPLVVLAVAGLGITIVLPIVSRRFVPGAEWVGAIGLVPIFGAAAAWWLEQRGRASARLVVLGAAAALFVIGLFGVVAQVVDRQQRSHVLLAAIQQFDPASEVGALGGLEPSWVFYGQRPIQELTLDASRASRGDSPFAPKGLMRADEFLEGNRHRVAIVHGRQMPALRERFGGRLVVLAEAPKFLKNESLHVVTVHEQLAHRPR